jgi:phage baseplate assembly protein gpV
MRQMMAMERRLQDIENGVRNNGRNGKVVEMKFDKERNGWYAKMKQGEDEEAFITDWLPWKTFASGSIKISIPPRVGQMVQMNAAQGQAEQGWLEPYHNDPDNDSPHDKPDEVFMRVQKPAENGKQPDPNETLDVLVTKDNMKVKIGKTTHEVTKDKHSVETENTSSKSTNRTVEAKKTTESADDHSLKAKSRKVQSQSTVISSSTYRVGGKVLINC